MVDIVNQRDPLAYALGANAAPMAAIVAGAAGNNAAVTGVTLDRQAYGMPLVAIFAILWETVLATGKTLSISGVKLEQSTDGVTWTPYVPPYPNAVYAQPGVVATGNAGGTVQRGSSAIEVPLSSAIRYVRFDMTPSLSAANTDTATLMTHARFGGFSHVPPP